ncbi:serine threonine phosphatase 6 regulatory ankyrin repeat subunit A [Fusarium beomiforme]|uniref:Serine threonine phosphatase 6 regulatory ankyrin repeat subunit A n=1 Tax=Fusarium beomiforme TaxID=44412 RepID=A0A9P5DUN5_9HYPO|nr:serine threonine phosphatase 6 regulatory ankyrin repeat subunit A [Fusarium beomiforme]
MTAISGAIRVEGHRFLKAFIGRARENRAAVEIEYMSSTSAEVGELYNGSGIVRTMGQSKIAQLIIFPEEFEKKEKSVRRLYDYQDDLDIGLLHWLDRLKCQLIPRGSSPGNMERGPDVTSTGAEVGIDGSTESNSDSPDYWESLKYPNLQLNIANKTISSRKRSIGLRLAALMALVLQASLLVIAGVVAYIIEGFERQPWGLPCYIGGSILLSVGMLACSVAIEKSTKEYKWIPGEAQSRNSEESSTLRKISQGTKRQMHLLWVQPAQRVSDQEFDSYILLAKNKEFISTSSRREDVSLQKTDRRGKSAIQISSDTLSGTASSRLGLRKTSTVKVSNAGEASTWYSDLLAPTAIFAGGAGFTVQFIGLRGLPWPCALAHLGAIVIMAMIRALIRWRLGERPITDTAPRGYELDFLAIQLIDPKSDILNSTRADSRKKHEILSWRVETAKQGEQADYPFDFPGCRSLDKNHNVSSNELSDIQHIVHVRKRLGDLCQWQEKKAFKPALALVRSIERFLDQFLPERQMPIAWEIPFRDHDEKTQMVLLRINKTSDKQHKGWKINAGEVEAILSLWMANLEENEISQTENHEEDEWQRSKAGSALGIDYCRLLGHKQDDGVLQRDINLWSVARLYDSLAHKKVKIVIGYTGPPNTPKSDTLLVQHSTADLATIAAQHLFTSFIWTVIEYLPKDFLNQGSVSVRESVAVLPPKKIDLQSFDPTIGRKLQHKLLTKFSLHAEKESLGSSDDVLLCMIPAFSYNDVLPNDAALQIALPKPRERKTWAKDATNYSNLLDSLVKNCVKNATDFLSLAILVHALEFTYLMVLDDENMECERNLRRGVALDVVDDSNRPNKNVPGNSGLKIISNTNAKLPHKKSSQLIEGLLKNLFECFPGVLKKLILFYQLQGRKEAFIKIVDPSPRERSSEIWVLQGRMEEQRHFMDQIGFTELHREVFGVENMDLGQLVGKDGQKRDIFGWTPLHYAAARTESYISKECQNNCGQKDSHTKSIQIFLQDGRPETWWLDNFGRSPIHVAAISGKARFLETLLNSLSPEDAMSAFQQKGFDGMTPLHLAVEGGRIDCIRAFEQKDKFRFDPNALDVLNKSLLSYLDESIEEQKSLGIKLLRDHSTKFQRQDSDGQTVWHHAIRFSDDKLMQKLKENHSRTIDSSNKNRETPLHLAVKYKDHNMLGLLLCFKADPSVNTAKDRSPLMFAYRLGIVNLLMERMKSVDVDDKKGYTPLHLAVQTTKPLIVHALLEKGASPDFADNNQRNALHHARTSWSSHNETAMKEIVRDLLRNSTSCVDVLGKDGETPLIRACIDNEPLDFITEIVELSDLENSKMNINQGDSLFGQSPLAWACEFDHKEAIQRLLPAKTLDLNKSATGFGGWKPLHFALSRGNLEAIRLLLDDERIIPGLRISNISRLDPVRYAIEQSSRYCLMELLRHPNAGPAILSASDWETIPKEEEDPIDQARIWEEWENAVLDSNRGVKLPYHKLAEAGRHTKLQSLCTQGLKVHERDPDGWTPADIAGRHGYKTLEEFLRRHQIESGLRDQPYRFPSKLVNLFRGPEFVRRPCNQAPGWDLGKEFVVGFCHSAVRQDRLPGWDKGSWAYHGDNGGLFVESGHCEPGKDDKSFDKNDVVGCGIDFETGDGYRTKNGVRLDSGNLLKHHEVLKGKLYPCIGLRTDKDGDWVRVHVTLQDTTAKLFKFKGPYSGTDAATSLDETPREESKPETCA